jgi:hypothetical protein
MSVEKDVHQTQQMYFQQQKTGANLMISVSDKVLVESI